MDQQSVNSLTSVRMRKMQSSQMTGRSAEGIKLSPGRKRKDVGDATEKQKVIIAVIPKRSKFFTKLNYAECENTTVENSYAQYVVIIKRVSLKSGLYLTFTLCVNLFLTGEHFLLVAKEPAAASVLITAHGLSPNVESGSLVG